jgi:hypothetical protein
MRAMMAVARREVIEKRFVFAAALAASAIPLLVPIVRGLTAGSGREVRGFVAVFVAWSFAAALAAAQGASVLAGEVATGRAAFFFSRPISTISIWAGKLAGAMLVALAAGLIVFAPSLAVDGRIAPLADVAGSTGRGLIAAGAAAFLLFLLSHAIATIVRSRSWLALVDLVLAAVVGFLAWDALRRLHDVWPDPDSFLRRASLGGGIVIAGVLLAAMHRGVARGRTDPRVAHRALSAAMWSGLLVASVALTVYSRWVLGAPASALDSVESASPFGSDGWISLGGVARGADAEFLYDTRTGRSQRVFATPVVSGDGATAAWAERESRSAPWVVRTMRLDQKDAAPQETKLSLRSPYRLFLSGDGSRLGSIEGGLLSVSELPSGHSLASVRIGPASTFAAGVFAGNELVRVYGKGIANEERVEIFEFDLRSRVLMHTGSAPSPRAWYWGSPLHDRFVDTENDRRRWTLRDGRTGDVLATLRDGGPLFSAALAWMNDGRWVLVLADETGSWLEVFSPSGQWLSRIPIGPKGRPRPGGEVGRGKLALALTPFAANPPYWDLMPILYVVDLDRGTAVRRADGLRPIFFLRSGEVRPGSEATKLFLDGAKGLVRFDPEKGERRAVLGPR